VLPLSTLTTLLICARSEVESDLSQTPFWREEFERYVAEKADEARMLVFATEPNVVVVERDMPGAGELIAALRSGSLPHNVSIVTLSRVAVDPEDEELTSGRVDAALSLPPGPDWDGRLDPLLQMPTRKLERFEVRFDVETGPTRKPASHHGLVLNMSAGGILIECSGLRLHPGDDVALNLPIPGAAPVEGRARVVRQPIEEHIGLRFEAFSGNGDARVRDFVAMLAAKKRP
jgi:PilZ domain